MLISLDILFTLLHLVIIFFNLLGWIFPSTLRLHFYSIMLTVFCWVILGIWYGVGYCPITDWQWQIKEKLGETNLPNSFIKYAADSVTGRNINADIIDWITLIGFSLATRISIYLNFIKSKKGIRSQNPKAG